MTPKLYILSAEPYYRRAMAEIDSTWLRCAREGEPLVVRLTRKKATRSLEQNARFHAICDDIARSGLEWAGKARDADAWKVLLVSGHATATKIGSEIVPGIEGEFVNVRESTASMSVARSSSLIEYAQAFAAEHGVALRDEVAA